MISYRENDVQIDRIWTTTDLCCFVKFWIFSVMTKNKSSWWLNDSIALVLIVYVQSTLVISKLKGPSETLRDIRSSTYQIFRIEENTNRTTKFHKWICN